MPNTVGPWGSSSSGVNTIPGTPTPLATVTSATWGGIGGSITSQADLQTALAAKASLSGATFTGTVQSTGGLWSVTAAGVANFTSITSGVNWGSIGGSITSQADLQTALAAKASLSGATFTGTVQSTGGLWSVTAAGVANFTSITSGVNWGGITGSSPQSSPSGGWSTAATFASSVSMGALTATSGTFASSVSMGALTATSGTFASSVSMGALTATSGTFSSSVSMGALTATTGYFNSGSGNAALEVKGVGNYTVGGNRSSVQIHRGVTTGNQSGFLVFGTIGGTSQWSVFNDLNANGGNDFNIWNGNSAVLSFSSSYNLAVGGKTITILGYSANTASLVLNNPGQYIGIGNLAANECKIANTTGATGAWDAANPNMDLFLGYANNLVLHTGNVGTNAATLQAAVASANAPKMGTYAQMIAWTVATGTTPYWYATDVTETDGLLGKLYQWNGSSWVAVGGAQTVTGRVVAGVISAGAVGAQAIAADVALVGQVLRNTGFTAGTTTAAPTGFKMSGTAFTSYCYNGDTTGIYSTSLSSYMEIGSGCSLGGYALGSLVLGRLINAGMKVYSPGTYTWVCPPGITQVVVTLSGGGGSGCHDASNPGAGGGAGCLTVISSVTPGTSYTVVCGAGGAGTSTTSGNDGGNSTFNGLTAQGGAAGHTGGGGYGGGAGPLGQATSGNGAMAQMATGAVYIMCGQGARGGGGGTDPGSTQWQTGTGFGVGGGSSAAGPGYGSGSDGKTSGSTAAGGQGVVILRW